MCDTWRQRNPEKRTYTWCRRRKGSQAGYSGSRIDYVIANQTVDRWIQNIKIAPSFKSDHAMVKFQIEPHSITRGRGLWKMNTQILSEIEYIERINNLIQETINRKKQLNPLELWECLKLEIILNTQDYCQMRALNKKMLFSQLELAISKLTNKENKTEQDLDLITRTQSDLDALIEEKTKGAIFRSKAKWYGDSEKSTKYFLNLEKSRAGAKSIGCVLLDSGELVHQPNKIIKEQKIFYQKLYKKDESIQFKLKNNTNIKLKEEMQKSAEGEFSEQEITDAIKQISRGKSPGCDGIPIEFYAMFWPKLKNIFCTALSYAYEINDLHDSAFKGIISLIPKKNKDSRIIKIFDQSLY